jgi:ubiquinone/menaquinone biosynthesis C-methylase UbiE
MPASNGVKAKKFFLKTNYPAFWTKKIRELKYTEGYEEHFIELLNVEKNGNVLEIGTGEGRFIPRILEKSAKYTGIDISKDMLRKAIERIPLSEKSKIDLIVADVESLPFQENSFPRAFCFGTIYFVPNKDQGIGEMGRVAEIVLIEFRNLLSPEIAQYYMIHRLVYNFQGLIRRLIERKLVKHLVVRLYGEDRYYRLKSYLITYKLIQPFYPVTLFSLRKLFAMAGMRVGRIEGYSSKSRLQTGWTKCSKPVLLVEATRMPKNEKVRET